MAVVVKPPISSYGCGQDNCEACFGDGEYRKERFNMNINLKDLSDRYLELIDRTEDPDDNLDDDETEELENLTKLNNQIGDLLDFPAYAESASLVEYDSSAIRDFALQFIEDVEMEIPELIRPHVDWKAVGEDLLGNYPLVEYDGWTFYVLR